MSCFTALEDFINKYHQQHLEKLNEAPRHYPEGEDSACVIGEYKGDVDQYVNWKSVVKEQAENFDNVERALEIELHSDINDFYGKLFSGPIYFNSEFGSGELIQAWNQDNFELLQQNIIGHLMMKKKLKQAATWFIGTIDESDKMLTVANDDGSVWIEVPGEQPSTKLADSIEDFLAKLTVKPTLPEAPQTQEEAIVEHPGIINSLKRMWNNLTSRR